MESPSSPLLARAADGRRQSADVPDWLRMSNTNTYGASHQTSHRTVSPRRRSKFLHGCLPLLLSGVSNNFVFVASSVLLVTTLSVVSVLAGQYITEREASNPGSAAARWVEDIGHSKRSVGMIGSLLVFAIVFRFNTCYRRWWDGRSYWGDLLSQSLDLALMTHTWIADRDLVDRMDRFTVVFAYASKALLRDRSLRDEDEDGLALVERGLLTREELDDMHNNPCWQPHYCLQMLREILFEVHDVPEGKGLFFGEKHKIHGQMFRCFDGIIKGMINTVGKCIRLSATGLPATYDAIVVLTYFAFFILASVVWGVTGGWMAPIVIFAASLIMMLLIVMGTQLTDPFGYDRVDIPLEAFCYTLETQVYAIQQRSKDGKMKRLAQSSTPVSEAWKSDNRGSIGGLAMCIPESLVNI